MSVNHTNGGCALLSLVLIMLYDITKNIVNKCPLTGLHKNLLGLLSVLRPVNITCDILHRSFCGKSFREEKISLADITSTYHAHSR